jgi:hypothetical protein
MEIQMLSKTDYRALYDREYVGAWELQGKDVVVKISKVIGGELTAIGGRKSKKPVISFEGKEKKMICNKTNAKVIATMYGNHVEDWIGKRITLFVGMTRDPSTGGDIECLRVRPTSPPEREAKAAQTATEESGEV